MTQASDDHAHCTSRRGFGRLFAAAGVAAAAIGPGRAEAGQDAPQLAEAGGQQAELAPGHFSPKGKLPSAYTIEAQKHQREILPFSDRQDFAEADRGFIAAPKYKVIMNDKGGVAWDIGRWDFLLQGKDFDSIHPSL